MDNELARMYLLLPLLPSSGTNTQLSVDRTPLMQRYEIIHSFIRGNNRIIDNRITRASIVLPSPPGEKRYRARERAIEKPKCARVVVYS